MTQKVFALDTVAGIQRDGTLFDKAFYTDGKWVRFQRKRPRKMGGYRVISAQLTGPSRGIWVNPRNGLTYIFSGYSDGLQTLTIDSNGVGSGFQNFTLNNFTPSNLNLWQFDGFYDVAGSGLSTLVAHPGQNLAVIDNTTNTPVLIGDVTGTTLSQIGVFTDSVTTTNGVATVTLAATNILIAAGQSITGAGIPNGTTVVSIVSTTVTLSANATASATVTATFNNNVSVSGGVVVLHPYVFVFGNDGLLRNCSAGNAQDWVSADANEVNVASGKIVKGLPVRGGSNSPSGLFWSLDSLIRVSYTPQSLGIAGTANFSTPTFWRYDIISSQNSILSSQCVIEYDGIYYWIGVDRFLLYNGTVKEIENNMNQNYFFDNLNYDAREKVWVTKVPRYGEVWWYYPRGDSTECNDAIVYNIRENTWYDAGGAIGARRSAGYFSQVFAFPVAADWVTTVSEPVFEASFAIVNGSPYLKTATYYPDVIVGQVISGTGITAGTEVQTVTTSGINGLGAITAGSGYVNGSYSNIPFITGTGFNGTANITVAGNIVTAVAIVNPGATYQVGDVLEVDDADLGGGTGFSIPVTSIWTMVITMTANATATGTELLTFSTQPDLIEVFQNEYGTDYVNGQNAVAIESYFETNDLGWVSGGPAEMSPAGTNRWLRLERVEPDFVMAGEMSLVVTGRPFAQGDDQESTPYVFDANIGKIDMKEQRRELRLRFISNIVGGNYQLGKLLLNADLGDVRGFGS
jgi:hypothetical protein